ncbi:MAG: hypothetical protein OER93_04885 [Thermoleophilia bacterium]|nr:hypothetical protein [Thermoleophilia bacterium]
MPITRPALTSVRVVVSDESAVADDAMRLAHDGLVESGFLTATRSGRRFTAPYLNPGTQFLVVYAGDEAIGTAILVDDGPFGLPADRAFSEEIDALRAEVISLSEVSGLAVSHRWRNRSRLVLGYVLGTVVRLNGARGAGHRALFAVHPRQAKLMSQVLMGELMFGPRMLMGAPGTLVVTGDAGRWVEYFTDPDAPRQRRLVAEYALQPDPDWLERHPPSGEWHEDVLPPLLEESGLESRLRDKIAILQSPVTRGGAGAYMVGMI